MIRFALVAVALFVLELAIALTRPWLWWVYAGLVAIGAAAVLRLWWWMHTWR